LVDDDEEDYLITRDIVEEIDHSRFTVDWVESYEKGLEQVKQQIHDVYLIDYRLGAQSGLDLIREAKEAGCYSPLILLTGLGDREVDQQALEAGASDYMVKGTLNASQLERSIRYSIREVSIQQELHRLNTELEARVAQRTEALALANEELRQSQRLYRSIASNYPNGVIAILEPDFTLIFADGKELIRLGLSRDDLQGHHLKEVVDEETYPIMHENLSRVFKGEDLSFEVVFRGYDYNIKGVPLSDPFGKIMQALIVANNITEQKKAAGEVLKALEKERQLNTLKSRFVSMASHEFRTPLSTIMSSVTLIGRYKDPIYEEKRTKHIDRIKGSVRNLNNILNDLLSLGKLEEGKISIHPETFDLCNFTQEVVEEHQAVAKEGQVIHYRHEGIEQLVSLDKHLLKNIFHNLLSNAIKYSPPDSEIEVRTHWQAESLTLEVQDQGMGIPTEEHEHLFERFFRARNATNIQGTGLGLNIVKEYVSLMDGKISFISKLEGGTTFTIILPHKNLSQNLSHHEENPTHRR
jgi:PAS domain S-box-containing protein